MNSVIEITIFYIVGFSIPILKEIKHLFTKVHLFLANRITAVLAGTGLGK